MSDFTFGDAPKNGVQVTITSNNPAPTPHHVRVTVNGALKKELAFTSRADAERAQQEELRNIL
jgi:hypothetical protein